MEEPRGHGYTHKELLEKFKTDLGKGWRKDPANRSLYRYLEKVRKAGEKILTTN